MASQNLPGNESTLEAYLDSEVRKRGGLTRKLQYVNRRGCPDRLVALNGLRLVELKVQGGVLSEHQKFEAQEIRKRGGVVAQLWSREDIDVWLTEVCA